MKRVSCILLIFFVFLYLMSSFPAMGADGALQAHPTDSSLYLNDILIEGYRCASYNIGGSNYFQLRNLASVFSGTPSRFDVQWDVEANAVNIITGEDYDSSQGVYFHTPRGSQRAIPMDSKLLVDGKTVGIQAYTIDGNNYFKLRDLGGLIPFDIEWRATENKMLLYSKVPEDAYRMGSPKTVPSNALKSFFPRWESELESHVFTDNRGNLCTLQVISRFMAAGADRILVTALDEGFRPISSREIPVELDGFGAFFSGSECNYIAFGQENLKEDDKKEVVRIVRYDKEFNRMDGIDVDDCYTITPFRMAARMDESGDQLVLHMGRTRYTTEDGLNHQSQLTVIVDKASMRVVNDLGRFQGNHVSHSFNQFVRFDDDDHVLVDHGDAYPRSVVLSKPGGYGYMQWDLFEIPGATGANCTGVSVGGFEVSASHYLVALNTIDHSKVTEYTSSHMMGLEIDQRDIVLCALSKDAHLGGKAKQRTLAKYVGTDKNSSMPHLVKICDNEFMVLWQEFDLEGRGSLLRYVFVDGNGRPSTETFSVEDFELSKCQPIVFNDKVVWFTDYPGHTIIYTIPL